MSQIYISLDLETTGFDPAADQVLEIAAIKFQDNKILEKFETLINPGIEIPGMVTHITGISSETVKDAPSFEAISDNLGKFLGNLPIVGHNIEFDLNFLEAKGIPILNKQIDTLKLASLLLHDMPSLSLETISRQLNITHENKHRAMSDAHVCFELFQILVDKISEIPAPTLLEIQTLIPRAMWDLDDIFLQAKSTVPTIPKISLEEAAPTDRKNIPPTIGSAGELIDLLSANSPLAQIVENYEHRPGQQKLVEKIIAAIDENYNLIAEAGTGTGKTLAYLMAAAYSKILLGKKTVISTYTNNLQDQIISKDFPLVKKLFPDLSIAILKGRKKYLSVHRFNELKNKQHLDEHELTTIIKTLLWLNKTTTGDLDELNLQNKETLLFDAICSDPDYHPPVKSQSIDFLDKARRQAEMADIVVANHALLIQDTLSESHILPEAPILIIDEAHHLEKTVTDALTVVLGLNRLIKLWDLSLDALQEIRESTLIFESSLEQLILDLRKTKIESLNLAESLFDDIRLTIDKFAHAYPGQPSIVSLNSPVITTSDSWLKAIDKARELAGLASDLQPLASRTNNLLLQHDLSDNLASGYLANLIKFHQECAVYLENPGKRISWISKGFDESIHWHFAPLSVQEIFRDKIFPARQSVILTSATLSTYGNFNYFRSELGLNDHFDEIRIPSHFSYPDQVKIIIPENLSEPRAPEYLDQCSGVIESVIRKNGGRTLVLFTAKKDLAKVFHELAPKLKTEGMSLLGQNISGGRGKIISHFSHEPDKCAILGTNSFWEGVDLIGSVLTCVIIQKLPFDPPDDPIIHARSLLFEKPFEQFTLPRAILRFKQGFGRLIRSSNDTGSVIILDSRLVQKSYGREFTSSLPEGIRIHQCASAEVADYL